MKSITQAHKDAIISARIECGYKTPIDKVVQIYLKSMMDDGYVMQQQERPVTAQEVGVLASDGSDC